MRTATVKTNLKPNESQGIRTLLLNCAGILQGIAEMFPEHNPGYRISTVEGREVPITPHKRGRPRANISAINGKKAA